ncbi:ribonuclease P protein component [Candidatus Schneideria nysicola]|uniref:ribonuclease P protein component n=1 Tax=Candidatus Schneideria nysicola TaxID=1081631 RepID=UPI001CAA720D|nr:ribonuclease P protein component [Candidatus Schneideria nysicola]UAJ65274.1 ribonuclease P protein component [Candidatus Schneideria nysicola]
MKKFKFAKKLRLLNSKHFSFVLQKYKKFYTQEIMILWRLNMLEYPRIGFLISKKIIKKSHERNRIKRLIREHFRINYLTLPNIDFIIIVKKNIVDLNNHTIKEQLEIIWRRCRQYHILSLD